MAILKKTAKAEQAVAVAEAAVKSAAVEQAPAAVKEARLQDHPEGFCEEGPRGEED